MPARIRIRSGFWDRTALATISRVRVFRPDAKEVEVVLTRKGDQRLIAERLRPEGFFQAILPGMRRNVAYQLQLTGADGSTATVHDPYAFGAIMGKIDLHLFSEGNHLQIYGRPTPPASRSEL